MVTEPREILAAQALYRLGADDTTVIIELRQLFNLRRQHAIATLARAKSLAAAGQDLTKPTPWSCMLCDERIASRDAPTR